MVMVAALPAVTASARYYSVRIGFIVSVSTPTGVRVSLYPPMLVPEVLLAAAAFYELRGARSSAAYLSIAALSYYIVVALELAHGLSYLRGLAVPYGIPGALYSVLVVPGARTTIYLPPLILMTIASASTLMTSIWPEVRRALEAADAEARRRFGVSVEERERTRPWAARALQEMARYLPEAGGGGKGEGES
jgi:hypothetical protein